MLRYLCWCRRNRWGSGCQLQRWWCRSEQGCNPICDFSWFVFWTVGMKIRLLWWFLRLWASGRRIPARSSRQYRTWQRQRNHRMPGWILAKCWLASCLRLMPLLIFLDRVQDFATWRRRRRRDTQIILWTCRESVWSQCYLHVRVEEWLTDIGLDDWLDVLHFAR